MWNYLKVVCRELGWGPPVEVAGYANDFLGSLSGLSCHVSFDMSGGGKPLYLRLGVCKIGPILGQRCIILMIFLEICGGHHKIVFMNLWDAPRIPSFDKIQFELSSISLCVASLTIDTFLSFTEGPW